MKLSTLVRAISPFSKTSKPKHAEEKINVYEWDLTSVDLKYALKLFYKKYNPEKSFIVSDILQKYYGEEQLLLRQLQERYNLSVEDIQSYLDRAILGGGGESKQFGGSKRKSLIVDDKPQVTSENDNGDWDLAGVDIVALLQHIYAIYNPSRTPNLDVLRQKSDTEILIILKQLCKRHNLSQSEMNDYVEQFRSTSFNRAEDPEDKEQYVNEEVDEVEEVDEAVDGAASSPDVFRPPPPSLKRGNSAQHLSIVSGRRSSVNGATVPNAVNSADEDSTQRVPVMSTRWRPQSDGKVALMDEVLRQMNGRQQEPTGEPIENHTLVSKPSPPPPPPLPQVTATPIRPSSLVKASSVDGKKVLELEETCRHQKLKIDELQHMVDVLLEDNRRYSDGERQQKPLMLSVGTQADDQELSFEAERLRIDLANERVRCEQLMAEMDKAKTEIGKLSAHRSRMKDHLSRADDRIETLQGRCKDLQKDREECLQFINALCAASPPTKALIENYLKIVADAGTIADLVDLLKDETAPLSDCFDAFLLHERSRTGGKESVDHRAIMNIAAEASHLASSFRGSEPQELQSQSADSSDENKTSEGATVGPASDILQQQFNIAKRLIETKRSQARLEGKLAETNLLLMQTASHSSSTEKDAIPAPKSPKQMSRTSTPVSSRNRKNQHAIADNDTIVDWIECIDPKSGRKYYYSPTLGKSTWSRPVTYTEKSDVGHDDGLIQSQRRVTSLRDASPASIRSTGSVSSASSSTSLFSQRSKNVRAASPALVADNGDWIAAIDPKTNRRYWYNRKTKQSTWRKPAELIS